MTRIPQYRVEGWRPHGPGQCKCPNCGGVCSTNALARARHKCPTKGPQIGNERWRLEHISYKAWCALARSRGWNGDDDADGLRAHCEPDEAATITFHKSLDEAKAAAMATWQADPDDSAFGAMLIEHQVLEAATDDRGNLVPGCRPEWETVKGYEITSDGDCVEYCI